MIDFISFVKGKPLESDKKTNALEGVGSFLIAQFFSRAVNRYRTAIYEPTSPGQRIERIKAIVQGVAASPLTFIGVICNRIGSLLRIRVNENDKDEKALMPKGADEIKKQEKRIDAIYTLFKKLDQVLGKHTIPYVLVAGSALGAVRHKGIIPWDDDGDVAIDDRHRKRLMALKNSGELKELHVSLEYDSRGDRFILRDLTQTDVDATIDIFVMTPVKVTVPSLQGQTQENRLVYSKFFRHSFPNEYLQGNVIDETTTERVLFGPEGKKLFLPIPKNADEYLERAYGSDWKTCGIKTHEHVHLKLFGTRSVPIPIPNLGKYRVTIKNSAPGEGLEWKKK